jgi:uncharacterized repeat protein (TIGR03803 family)
MLSTCPPSAAPRGRRAFARLSHALVFVTLAGAVFHASAAKAQSLVTLHSFSVDTEGGSPKTDMILVGGALVGTTTEGGTYNGGTLFSFDLSSKVLTAIYDFGHGQHDGSNPSDSVDLDGGVFYGTTYDGGTRDGNGTAFGISATTGQEVFRYVFRHHGFKPNGGLIGVGDHLFGTVADGCGHAAGCVFRLNPATSEQKILYAFKNGPDGGHPYSRLLRVGKRLYGTTQQGGAANAGTVFVVDAATGAETVLYSFKGGVDGTAPPTGLIYGGGLFYGTTVAGGSANDGTVFSLDPDTGVKTILHSFAGPPGDGLSPYAIPTLHDGALYGTTENGGVDDFGTVWGLALATGGEKVLYSFTGQADGNAPIGQLLYDNGAFYGTTSDGGEGSIFEFTP